MNLSKKLTIILFAGVVACGPQQKAAKYTPKEQSVQKTASEVAGEQPKASESQGATAMKVALLVPLSGEGSGLGQAMMNASLLALDDQSKYTGLKKSDFVLIPKDTRSSPAEAMQAAELALREGAEVVLGPIFSNSLEVVLPALRYKNLSILSFSNNTKFAGHGAYLMGFSPEQQVQRVLDYAIAKGKRNFAVLLPRDAYGNLIGAYVQSYFQNVQDGAKLSGIEYYPAGAADVGVELGKLKDAAGENSFDALLIPEGGRRLENIAATLTAQKVDPSQVMVLGSGQWDDDSLRFPEVLQGAVFASSEPSRRRNFESHYAAVFGARPPRLASLAYDATAMLVSYAARGIDAGSLKNHLDNGEAFVGPVDGLFKPRGDGVFERGLAILQVTGGGVKVVDSQPDSF